MILLLCYIALSIHADYLLLYAAAFEESAQTTIRSISIWEIALKVKRQKLFLPMPIKDSVQRLEELASLEILAVDTQM